ncbi:hypothetical protein BLOT_002862 [Blomia tropicalis]|nr:hypothetical protein BLOT_002862 [Blomia tropicalis]
MGHVTAADEIALFLWLWLNDTGLWCCGLREQARRRIIIVTLMRQCIIKMANDNRDHPHITLYPLHPCQKSVPLQLALSQMERSDYTSGFQVENVCKQQNSFWIT